MIYNSKMNKNNTKDNQNKRKAIGTAQNDQDNCLIEQFPDRMI